MKNSLINHSVRATFAPKSDIENRTFAGVTFTREEIAEITAELEWFELMEAESAEN
jgi:hypothetical protein